MTLRSDTISFSLLYRSFSCTHTHTVCRVPFIAPCVCAHSFNSFFFTLYKKKRWNCEDTLDCIQQIQISSMWNIGESLLAVHKPTGFFSFLMCSILMSFTQKKVKTETTERSEKKEYTHRDTSNSNELVFIKWREQTIERERETRNQFYRIKKIKIIYTYFT